MAAEITVFRLPAKHLGQLGGANVLSQYRQAGAAAVSIDWEQGCIQEIDQDSAVSATAAVTCANVPALGMLILILKASGSGTVTFTLSTGFLVNGTAAPTTGKQIAIAFVSNGTNFVELCRTSAAV